MPLKTNFALDYNRKYDLLCEKRRKLGVGTMLTCWKKYFNLLSKYSSKYPKREKNPWFAFGIRQ